MGDLVLLMASWAGIILLGALWKLANDHAIAVSKTVLSEYSSDKDFLRRAGQWEDDGWGC